MAYKHNLCSEADILIEQYKERIAELEEDKDVWKTCAEEQGKATKQLTKRVAELETELKSTVSKEIYDQLHIDFVNRGCRIAELEVQINGFWEALHNSYDIESREEIEKDCKESWVEGTCPLEVALHFVWKREPKVVELEAENKELYRLWQAYKCICQNCGEMRTETEVNDRECYACGKKNIKGLESDGEK